MLIQVGMQVASLVLVVKLRSDPKVSLLSRVAAVWLVGMCQVVSLLLRVVVVSE